MSLVKPSRSLGSLFNSNILRLLFLFLICAIIILSYIYPFSIRQSTYSLEIGNVSNLDIQAPRTITYQSKVLYENAVKEAEASVSIVYLPADPAITRQQIEDLRLALSYVDLIRNDEYAKEEEKDVDLYNIENIVITDDMAEILLSFDENDWKAIQDESLIVLESAMRNSIRDYQLNDAKRNVPTLISFSFNQTQSNIITSLVTPFVTPTSLYSEDQTQALIAKATENIEPVERTIIAGETIVQKGEIITPIIYEGLQQYGLIQPQDTTKTSTATVIYVLLLAAFTALYLSKRNLTSIISFKSLILIASVFLLFLISARVTIPNRTVLPYIFPLAAFGLTIASLFTVEISIVLSLSLSLLTGYGLQNGLEISLFYFLPTIFGILILGNGRRIANFFWSGIAVAISGIFLVFAYRLPDSATDWIGIATLSGASIFNGVAAASVTLILQYLISQLLGITTAMQLLELSRPDNALLQFVLNNAPGSYQHSLQVANLAEQAAEAIGADGLLVRVGSRYHDAGKSLNPTFFIENQISGSINPHDDLDSLTSAQTIIRHVNDGIQLAKKYHLPQSIQAFINEHHGTLITEYQYAKAVKESKENSDSLDVELFRYPGPKPQTRETALVMLADKCEAKARAEVPRTEEDLKSIVKNVIDYCSIRGQLEDTEFTQKELQIVSNSFVKTLLNTYHPRIQYPDFNSKKNDQ